nr:MAG TPA: hypothetical protein [Caudoviricetes sp.]
MRTEDLQSKNGHSKADRISDGSFSVLICSRQLEWQPLLFTCINIHLQATIDQLVKRILIGSLTSCLGQSSSIYEAEKVNPA